MALVDNFPLLPTDSRQKKTGDLAMLMVAFQMGIFGDGLLIAGHLLWRSGLDARAFFNASAQAHQPKKRP